MSYKGRDIKKESKEFLKVLGERGLAYDDGHGGKLFRTSFLAESVNKVINNERIAYSIGAQNILTAQDFMSTVEKVESGLGYKLMK